MQPRATKRSVSQPQNNNNNHHYHHHQQQQRNEASRQSKQQERYAQPLTQLLVAGALIALLVCLGNTGLIKAKSATAGERAHHLTRIKRSLYELPDGAEYLLGDATSGTRSLASNNDKQSATPTLKTTFSCDGLGYGYYADPDNDCKIFHICQSFRMSDGSIYNNHWSFICGNQTVFNQVTLSCSHPEDAVPCENAKDFYHVNDYFGDLQAPSVKQSDLDHAQELVSRAYGSRLPSGAPSGH